MNAWSVSRKATAEDVARFEAFERRFKQRHASEMERVYLSLDDISTNEPPRTGGQEQKWECSRLHRLYRAGVRRALGPGVDGISRGYVGFYA